MLLSHLIGLDFYISYFNRRTGRTYIRELHLRQCATTVAFSIETRPEVGEGFAPARLPLQTIRVDLRGG